MHISHTLSQFIRTSLFMGIPLAMVGQAYRPMVFVGYSMSPTYHNGDLAITVPYDGTVDRGDVVVLKTPSGTIVKRVAMLPGDVYGQRFSRHGIVGTVPATARLKHNRDSLTELRVPDGYVFVLGDNALNSFDSRTFGPVPQAWIQRKLMFPRPDETPTTIFPPRS